MIYHQSKAKAIIIKKHIAKPDLQLLEKYKSSVQISKLFFLVLVAPLPQPLVQKSEYISSRYQFYVISTCISQKK